MVVQLASAVALGAFTITNAGEATSALVSQVFAVGDTNKVQIIKFSINRLFGDGLGIYVANNVAMNIVTATICKINKNVYLNL